MLERGIFISNLLEKLDQWALGILMGICTLFGVKDLPQTPDPHWQVEERWVEQPDGHLRLKISSQTIQEECRSGHAKYIIFPQTYMAVQEVYADGVRVYTNEMDSSWHLKSFLDRPVLSCDFLDSAKKIDFVILSYEKFFATLSGWPKTVVSYPKDQIFYTAIYAFVGILSAMIGIIFFVIGLFLGEKVYHILILSFAIFLLMFSHYSEHFYVPHIYITHQLSLISLMIIPYVLICEHHFYNLSLKSYFIFLMITLFEVIVSYSHQHTVQLFIVVNGLVAVTIIMCMALKKDLFFGKRLILFLTSAVGVRDIYASHIGREGFFHLSFLSLVLILYMSYQLIIKIYERNLKHQMEKESIQSDKRVIEKTREINFKIRQILHDMKSPVTSLNFLSSSSNYSIDAFRLPINRLNKLLQLSTANGDGILIDWYSAKILDNSIRLIVEEKKIFARNTTYTTCFSEGISVFFDPDVIKFLIAELIDNSIKNNNEDIKINIELILNQETTMVLKYKDYGVGISKEKISNIGILGYSSSGTGIGIFSILERLKVLGAKIDIKTDIGSGFLSEITFLTKNAKEG